MEKIKSPKWDPQYLYEVNDTNIYYVIFINVVDNVVKSNCIKCFKSHKDAIDNLWVILKENKINMPTEYTNSLALGKDTNTINKRSHIYGYDKRLASDKFFGTKVSIFAYVEMANFGECIQPLTIEEMKKYYEKSESEINARIDFNERKKNGGNFRNLQNIGGFNF